jgi:hypothetical protein
VRRSAHGVAPAPRRARSRPPPARGRGAAMPPACPVGWRAPFLEFVQASGRTPGQHPRRSTEAARLHRHGDELWLDRRQETGRGRRPEKRASTPEATRPALRALVAFRRGAMAHKSRALAVGAVQPWRDHRGSLSDRWFCATQTPIKKSRSTELKHLPPLLYHVPPCHPAGDRHGPR